MVPPPAPHSGHLVVSGPRGSVRRKAFRVREAAHRIPQLSANHLPAPPAALKAEVGELMAYKALTLELGEAPLPPAIREIDRARPLWEIGRAKPNDEEKARAAEFYRDVVERLRGGGGVAP